MPIFDPISPIHYWIQKIMPLVYDDSLSLYELVAKIADKLNEVINIVNPIGSGIDEYIKEAMEQYKAEWEKELKEFQSEIVGIINNNNEVLNNRITNLDTSLNKRIDDFEAEINQELVDTVAKIKAQIDVLSANISTTDQANRVWTLAQIEIALGKLPDEYPMLIDPSDGKREALQTILNHMWDGMGRDAALTAAEYDALMLSAEQYDAYQLTAQAYDTNGKNLLKLATV